MKMKSIIGVFLVLVFVACSSSSRKEYKLSDERLAHLMLDLQLAEVTLLDLIPAEQDSLTILFDKRLEEIYHLSEAEIRNEIDKLQSDPEKLKWVVNRVKEMTDSIQ